MNVLYISYDGMTDPLGQSQVIPYLIGLSKKGHTITLISCEKKDRFERLSGYIQKLLETNHISWLPVPYATSSFFLSKQINLKKIQSKAFKFCKENTVDIVHCRSYMAALIGLKIKQKFNSKFIFDMRGFWADERIDGRIWQLSNPLHKKFYKFFKKKELEFLHKADYTISLTESAKNEILSWKSFKNQKISIKVIPCCADLELFSRKKIDPAELELLKAKLEIAENDFLISYLGSIGTWYMLDEMLDFFKCLSEKHSNAKFLFITPDSKEEIISKAKAKGIDPAKLLIHSANRNEVPLFLSLSKISIYFIKPLYSKKASSPTKTAEIMGLGIPIITNTGIGDSDAIIKDAQSGVLISEFTNNEYMRIINQIDLLLNLDKAKIAAGSKNYFSLEKGVESYTEVYDALLTNKAKQQNGKK